MKATSRQVKVIRWVMFSAVIPVSAIVVAMVLSRVLQQTSGVAEVLSRGELLIIGTTVACTGAGELFGSRGPSRAQGMEAFIGGFVLVVAVISALSYGGISNAITQGHTVDSAFVAGFSILMYTLSVVSGGFCVALSEGELT